VAILNFGTLLPEAAQVADKLNATLVDMRFVKPLDDALILQLAADHDVLVTWKRMPLWAARAAA
jgi:1-deoxy-D-xylulose-5-phosphate synthase